MQNIGIIGAGGQADEVQSYLVNAEVQYRAVDSAYVAGDLVDIDSLSPEQIALPVVFAVGSPYVRKQLVDQWKGTDFSTIYAESARIHESSSVGAGAIVGHNAVITTNCVVGQHVIINIGVTISHNVEIGDYVTISPGANIAGNVSIGDGVFVGIGAIVKNGVKIASGTVVGAGAVVVEDITEENCVYVGVPARRIAENESWMREI